MPIPAADEYEFPSLTLQKVAERIGVSETTLFRMLARGEGPPSFVIGSKRRYFRECDLIAWVQRQRDDRRRKATPARKAGG